MSRGFRTQATHDQYQTDIANGHLDNGCPLCDKEEKCEEFTHWRIVSNKYPYDDISKQHDMIIPKRHVDEDGITTEEWAELKELKRTVLNDRYEFAFESLPRRRSIPAHFHLHLLVPIHSKD